MNWEWLVFSLAALFVTGGIAAKAVTEHYQLKREERYAATAGTATLTRGDFLPQPVTRDLRKPKAN